MDVKENISLVTESLPPATSPAPEVPLNEMRLVDIPVSNENVALNLMVSFLSLAQKRGSFSLDESAKIWECVQKFQMPAPASS